MSFISFWIIKNLKKKKSTVSCFLIIFLSFSLVTAALIFSKSMIEGMQDRLINLNSGHLTVFSSDDMSKTFNKNEIDSYRVVSGFFMLYTKENSYSVLAKGVEEGYLEERSRYIRFEKNPDVAEKSVIVSKTIADALNIGIGDKIAVLIVPDGSAKVVRPDVVSVNGIYSSGYSEIDNKLIFTNLTYAERIFQSPASVTTEFILKNYSFGELLNVKKQLNDYIVKDWTQINYDIFRNLVSSNQVIFIILLLIILVASYFCFSITQHILFENQYNISVCKILGADNMLIKKIVFSYISGTIIFASLTGLLFGIILGSNLSSIIRALNFDNAVISNYLLDFDIAVPWKSIIAMFIFQILFSAFFIFLQLSGKKNTILGGLFT